MTTKNRSHLYQWEQEMIDAYHDHQWHLVIDPLYEKFQVWKTGKVSHRKWMKQSTKLTNPAIRFTACSLASAIS